MDRPLRGSFGQVTAVLALASLAVAGGVRSARALPAFTRSTGLACAGCHTDGARLNARGMRFLAQGYRWRGEGGVAARPSASVLGLAGLGVGDRDTRGVPDATPQRERASMLEAHVLGTAGRGWSWHLAQRVGTTAGTLETRIAELRYDLGDADAGWGVHAGRFEAGLPFLAQSRRPTLAPYRTAVSFMAEGVELSGSRGVWSGSAGVTEDHRTPAPGTRITGFGAHLQDPYFWIAAGGERLAIGGRMWFDREDSDLPFHTWLQHMQHEVAAHARLGRVELTPAYVLDRYDDRPAAELHDKHHMGMLEVAAPLDPSGRWWLAGRIEHEYRPLTPFTPSTTARRRRWTWRSSPVPRRGWRWSGHAAATTSADRAPSSSTRSCA